MDLRLFAATKSEHEGEFVFCFGFLFGFLFYMRLHKKPLKYRLVAGAGFEPTTFRDYEERARGRLFLLFEFLLEVSVGCGSKI